MDGPRVTLACSACGHWNRVDPARAAAGPKCGHCGTPLPLDHPIALGDATFARTVDGSDLPVLVDFYADWCGPCTQMAPAVAAVAHAYAGRALVAKLDTDRAPETSARFGIRAIPTVIVFAHGREVARQTGAAPRVVLERLLADALTRAAADAPTRAPGAAPSSAG